MPQPTAKITAPVDTRPFLIGGVPNIDLMQGKKPCTDKIDFSLGAMNVILDCNCFDKLASASNVLCAMKTKISRNELTIVVTRRLWAEICNSPHRELAVSLQLKHVGESVMFAGDRVGDRVGSGRLYHDHLGCSKKRGDALIADAADYDADLLVSEDNRLRKRTNEYSVRCKAVSFDDFANVVHG